MVRCPAAASRRRPPAVIEPSGKAAHAAASRRSIVVGLMFGTPVLGFMAVTLDRCLLFPTFRRFGDSGVDGGVDGGFTSRIRKRGRCASCAWLGPHCAAWAGDTRETQHLERCRKRG